MTIMTAPRTNEVAPLDATAPGRYFIRWTLDGKKFEWSYLEEGLTANQAQQAFYDAALTLKGGNPRRRRMSVDLCITTRLRKIEGMEFTVAARCCAQWNESVIGKNKYYNERHHRLAIHRSKMRGSKSVPSFEDSVFDLPI